jgi:hypothetical protein
MQATQAVRFGACKNGRRLGKLQSTVQAIPRLCFNRPIRVRDSNVAVCAGSDTTTMEWRISGVMAAAVGIGRWTGERRLVMTRWIAMAGERCGDG